MVTDCNDFFRRIPKVPDMATSPASQTNGMESGGAAPFHDILTKTSDATGL